MGAITFPYCNKTYSVRCKLLMRLEWSPQKGNRDAEICPKLETMNSPARKWIKIPLKGKGNMHGVLLHPKKPPSDASDYTNQAQTTTNEANEDSGTDARHNKKGTSETSSADAEKTTAERANSGKSNPPVALPPSTTKNKQNGGGDDTREKANPEHPN